MQRDLVNHVIRRIHDDLQFFRALALQFECYEPDNGVLLLDLSVSLNTE